MNPNQPNHTQRHAQESAAAEQLYSPAASRSLSLKESVALSRCLRARAAFGSYLRTVPFGSPTYQAVQHQVLFHTWCHFMFDNDLLNFPAIVQALNNAMKG